VQITVHSFGAKARYSTEFHQVETKIKDENPS
jgi:hypothetical protein